MSYRHNHEIAVSNTQIRELRCPTHKTTQLRCPVDKFPYNKLPNVTKLEIPKKGEFF
uniref:Uncharacterized protein n=1 Tax=Arundo donax TaxID=35708 RepID=A0A0A9DVL3_ARUDO